LPSNTSQSIFDKLDNRRPNKELADLLEANGTEVKYAIHSVAGRMRGHMNVLLAEADVPYDQLVEMDAINPLMPTIDVALVIGANDVVHPAAREDKSSPNLRCRSSMSIRRTPFSCSSGQWRPASKTRSFSRTTRP
jgi:hypothetical protein